MLNSFDFQIQADDFSAPYEPTFADLAELHDEDADLNECGICGDRIDAYALSPLCDACDAAEFRSYVRERDYI